MQTLFERKTDLSVIVPVYNLERYIMPLLRTLLTQNVGDYIVEYIFVLNNCTDDSRGMIEASGLNCTIIECPEQGCGLARNAGFEIATGKYIWFMDGDDFLMSDTAIRDALDKVYADDLDILLIPFNSNLFQMLYFSMVWQYVFRRDFIAEFKFPAIQPCEDDVYMEQVLAKAGLDRNTYLLLPRIDRPLYFYNYMREGSNMYRVTVLHESI